MAKDTPDRILEAADRVLASAGYAGTSMRAVAEEAGVNKALVFYHFESKQKLIEHVLERYYQAHLQALASAFAGPGSQRERFHRVVGAYVDFISDHQRFPRLVQQMLSTEDPGVEGLVERGLGPMFEWVHSVVKELTESPPAHLDARQLFVTFSNAVVGYYTQAPLLSALWGEDPFSESAMDARRAHLHWLLDAMLKGLGAE